MTKTCHSCNNEYEVKPFSFDSGCCPACRPPFLSLSIGQPPGSHATASLWKLVLTIHVFYLFFSSIILCSEAGIWWWYSLVVIIYCLVRIVIGQIRGYPTLTRRQELTVLALPLWGPILMGLLLVGLQLLYEATGLMAYLERT